MYIKKIANFFFCMLFCTLCVKCCFAIKNKTHINNESVYKKIINTHSIPIIADEYFDSKNGVICDIFYGRMTFAINSKNSKKIIVSTPVYNKILGFVGEVITPIEFENVNTVDDVLRAMTSNSETIPKFKLGSVGYKHFWSPRKVLDKYLDQDYLLDFVRNNCETEDDIVTFYEYSPDCIFFKNSFDIDNIKLVCKSTRDNTEYGRFTFKEPGVLKSPLDSSKSVGLLDIIFGHYSKAEEYHELPSQEHGTKMKMD